ncbi:MAG: LPS export ABC transporter periplasmic protein LptC [Acidobacteria bacterium]|nr:LPS export ABC transporter periplasmic protein LptC [Acidobacteriota bacterium]
MRPPATRVLRRVLLGVVVVVAVAVAWTLRRPSAPTPVGDSLSGEPAEGTTIGDMAFSRFEGGAQKLQVKARDSRQQEGGAWHYEGVEVTFPFVARERESSATITSDECLYDPDREEALFTGNVHVVTDDGFELRTESLQYLGRQGRVRSEVDVHFERGSSEGRARGAEYRTEEDVLELESEVWLRFGGEDGGPITEIESGRARGSRKTRVVSFGQGVEVRQGARVLRSKRLQLILDDELENLKRAAAIGDVELLTRGGGDLAGVGLPPGGERRLRARRLNMDFGPGGALQRAIAINHAVLEVLPGPGDPPEKRRIAGRQIRFQFDGEGRLTRVVSLTGGPRPHLEVRPVVLTSEPVGPGEGVPRRIECRYFRWDLDPVTGALRTALFRESVSFTEPGRRGWAEQAAFDEEAQRLRLTGGAPRIVDDGDGSELQAQEIEVATDTRGVVAVGGVRHAIRRGEGPEGGMLAGSEPAVLVCRRFEYDAQQRKAWYRENALLRSGRDEVRAPLIVLEDPGPSQRRLHATGGVVSLLHPRTVSDAGGEPAAVNTRSQEMVYEEAAGRVVYSGEVVIRQGDIVTRSPEAVVTLTEDGDDVQKIVAGEPVEVRQGARRAEGRVGTYTPGNETMVLEGDEVVLQDVDRSVRGRVLTFQVGEDRIRVDGQEEVRTEAIFRKKELPTP